MVFREGDSPIPVHWYFASTDAYAFPGWHAFPSANWRNRQTTPGALGEQPGSRTWRNGSPPVNAGTGNLFALQCTGGVDAEWFKTGIPAGEESGPYYASGLPVCCVDGPPVEQPCEDCGAVPESDLVVSFVAPDCPCLDGRVFTLSWDAFASVWVVNGIELCDDCPVPNVGAITLSRLPATEPCELQLDAAQLFCSFGLGLPTANAICSGDGTFLFADFTGTIGGGGPCDGAGYSARVEPPP